MEEMNTIKLTKVCKINGIEYMDPTGELRRIMWLTESMIRTVHELYTEWDDATAINDSTIRHCTMDTLRDSIDRMTYCIQKVDNLVDLKTKEVYHETD